MRHGRPGAMREAKQRTFPQPAARREQGRVAADHVFAMHERLVSKVLPAFDLSLSMISGW